MRAIFSPQRGMLSLDETQVRLTEQTQICLAYFCQHEGELVSRDALTQACWGSRNVVVTDATVRQTIFRLRKSLADVGLSSDTLQTVGKAGYRLTEGAINLEKDILQNIENVEGSESALITETDLKPRRFPLLQQHLHTLSWRLKLLLVVIALAACGAGFYLRLNQFITSIHYESFADEGGRHYYFSTRIPTKDKEGMIKRTGFWLDKEHVQPEKSQYVYMNGMVNAYIVALTCSGPIENNASACRVLTILGDNHS